MSYEKVEQAKKTIIGSKQTVKAIRAGKALAVVVAQDAEGRAVESVIQEANLSDIPISYVDSREKLGKACGIQVSAAVVAITS